MKYYLSIILFFFLAALAYGQALQSDSTYIIVDDGQFYSVRRTVDQNGERITKERPLTDTAQLQDFVYRISLDKAFEYASYVNEAWKKPQYTKFLLAASSALQSSTGKTLFQLSAEREADDAVGVWQVSTDSGQNFTAATISQESLGSLQISVGAQTYTLLIVGGAWVRILGFQGGVDLHRVNQAVEFRSLDETIILKK